MHRLTLSLVTALLCVCALGACGSGGAADPAAAFRGDVKRICSDLDAAQVQAIVDADDQGDSLDAFGSGSSKAVRAAVGDLRDLDPPAALRGAAERLAQTLAATVLDDGPKGAGGGGLSAVEVQKQDDALEAASRAVGLPASCGS